MFCRHLTSCNYSVSSFVDYRTELCYILPGSYKMKMNTSYDQISKIHRQLNCGHCSDPKTTMKNVELALGALSLWVLSNFAF